MDSQKVKKNWKQRLKHEMIEYWINVIYISIFFSSVVFYRRMVLIDYNIFLDDYFMGVIKALVIAKVIMIGAFLKISKKYEHKPLIIPVIYKAFLFTIWVIVFDLVEVYIKGFIGTPDFGLAFHELKSHITYSWLGATQLIFIVFIPFFAFKELARVTGGKELIDKYFSSSSK